MFTTRSMSRGMLFSLALQICLLTACAMGANGQEPDTNAAKLKLYDKIRSCTVKVYSDFGHGSGVAVKRWGSYVLIVTNAHVVTKDGAVAAGIRVKPWSRGPVEPLPAYLVHKSLDERSYLDVAFLLVVDAEKTISIADVIEPDSEYDWRKETVYSCGNPREEEFLVDHGHVLPNAMKPGSDEWKRTKQVVFHSAMVEHGNSGGGLFDARGELVGINTWLLNEKIGMAIDFQRFNRYFEWDVVEVKANSDDWEWTDIRSPCVVHMLAMGTWTCDTSLGRIGPTGFASGNERALHPELNYGSLLAKWEIVARTDPSSAEMKTIKESPPVSFNHAFAGPNGAPVLYKNARIASLALPAPPKDLPPPPLRDGKPLAYRGNFTRVAFRINAQVTEGNTGWMDVFYVAVSGNAGINAVN